MARRSSSGAIDSNNPNKLNRLNRPCLTLLSVLKTWVKFYRISQQERYYAHGTLTDAMYALFCSMAFVLNGRRSAVSGP